MSTQFKSLILITEKPILPISQIRFKVHRSPKGQIRGNVLGKLFTLFDRLSNQKTNGPVNAHMKSGIWMTGERLVNAGLNDWCVNTVGITVIYPH